MLVGYFAWHYSYAYVDGYRIFIDGSRFLMRFFSFKKLSTTLFRPLGDVSQRGIVMRIISRMYGAGARLTIIGAGAICLSAWWLTMIGAALVWPFLPLITAGGLVASFIGLSFAA